MTPVSGNRMTTMRLVIISGNAWVTQRSTETEKMARAFWPSGVKPSGVGKRNRTMNNTRAKTMTVGRAALRILIRKSEYLENRNVTSCASR